MSLHSDTSPPCPLPGGKRFSLYLPRDHRHSKGMTPDLSSALAAFKACIGEDHVLTGQETSPYFHDYSGRYEGKGLAVLRPANTQEVAGIVTICAAHKIAIIPQGGNTGLVGGSIPYQDNAVVISLKRMNAILSVDADNATMTVQAGCILQTIQNAAQDKELYFPLALGAQGSCSIGGNIATNAGGILTIRYGNTRDLVLGLEVVLPDGRIWNGLRSLRKDNTGYNLKHLFIGSEGTLGIITAAVLKLYPDPGKRVTFFAAAESLDNVVAFLGHMRATFGDTIQAFELLSRRAVESILRYMPGATEPMESRAAWNILVEVTGSHDDTTLERRVEDCVANGFEQTLVIDAVIAQNEAQRRRFWEMRECVSDAAQAIKGGSIKHDVSVPIAALPAFVRDADQAVTSSLRDVLPVVFGHVGDGNLHYDLVISENGDTENFLSRWPEMNRDVHEVAQHYNGSFAAEHGVGHFKTREFMERKPAIDQDMMRRVKHAIDPQNIMNPNTIWVSND